MYRKYFLARSYNLTRIPCKITKEFGTFCHDLTYKYGKITPGYVPNSLVILYDISCVILQNPAFFFYKILQEFLLGLSSSCLGRPYHFSSPTADSGRDSFFSHLHTQDNVANYLASNLLACHAARTQSFPLLNSLLEDTIASVKSVGQAIGHSTGSADPSLMG